MAFFNNSTDNLKSFHSHFFLWLFVLEDKVKKKLGKIVKGLTFFVSFLVVQGTCYCSFYILLRKKLQLRQFVFFMITLINIFYDDKNRKYILMLLKLSFTLLSTDDIYIQTFNARDIHFSLLSHDCLVLSQNQPIKKCENIK